MDNKQTANIIKVLAKEKGTNPTNVFQKIGISKNFIHNLIKQGSKPSVESIEKLADYFNVSTDYILGREEKKNLPNNIDQSVHSSMIEYNAPVANSDINPIEKEKKLPVIQAIVDGVESLEETDQAEVLLYIYKLKNKPSKN